MAAAFEMRLTEDVKKAITGHIDAAPGQPHLEEVECPICKNTAFDSPVKTIPCGHLHHKDCLADWVKRKAPDDRRCTLCQTRLTGKKYQASDLTLRRILDGIEVECPQQCAQPAKRMRYGALRTHIEQCPKTPVVCANDDCDEKMDRAVMEATHVAACYHALVTCEQCGSGAIKRGELQTHKTQRCTQRPYKCGHCGTDGLVHSEREEHEAQCTGPAKISDLVQLKRENKLILHMLAHNMDCPVRIVVKSEENPLLVGKYELLPQRFNGAPVYGHSSGYRVYRTCSSSWMVAMSDKTMKQNRGSLHSVNKNSPVLAEGSWVHINDKGEWQAAPGTSIVAEPTD